MYYPYLRGKQFELVLIREMAPLISKWGFTPIIEPVRENFPALKRAIDSLKEHGCSFVVIINPAVGTCNDTEGLHVMLQEMINGYSECGIGYCLSADSTIESANEFLKSWKENDIAFVHYGFTEGKALSDSIKNSNRRIFANIFVENKEGLLYRKHFKNSFRVIIEDAFIQKTNREYQRKERFSELYLTYEEIGCDAFGDFLTVSSEYRDSGGPAYAIAIHVTYVDSADDNAIHINHYVSDDKDSARDPAGKFFQALGKLVDDVQARDSLIFRSKAIEEYLELFHRKHYPGLGYVKKLSMQHHLELMAHVLGRS